MPFTSQRLLCPDCGTTLRREQGKMNITIDQCADHGLFLDRADVQALVSDSTLQSISDIANGSTLRGGNCPSCRQTMRQTQLSGVPVQGCISCGGLWFRNADLREHVHQVRTRAYGAGSMAARVDVMRDAAAFYPPEMVAGILTDFDLEHEL